MIDPSINTADQSMTSPQKNCCPYCGKSWPSNAHLIRHLRVHTGERPFKCDLCNKAYKEKKHLIEHARSHTGEKPFNCVDCNKTFVSFTTHLMLMSAQVLFSALNYFKEDENARFC